MTKAMRNPEAHFVTLRDAREPGSQVGQAMCDGKQVLTWARAKAILDRTPRKARIKTAYHCPVCHAWHIGGPMRKKRAWRTV